MRLAGLWFGLALIGQHRGYALYFLIVAIMLLSSMKRPTGCPWGEGSETPETTSWVHRHHGAR
jgi:hypothetical protein